ncbi:ras guanine nucleotide exchange factor i-related [Anaeramoeba flamelloides]|uniref:Ras guanine nucleotide exchange factor i-related n=1 Tax=Anaeramoeba flamelloides TaxID=1746091 RepID=A0AAV7Z5U6_9EUKA|nr:ras guanine nucleotide exchange factor i-related [Anaeramoeba flamelloides]
MSSPPKGNNSKMVLTPRMTLANKKKIYYSLQKRKKYLTKLRKKSESLKSNLKRHENNFSLRAPEKFKVFQERFEYLLEINELEMKRTNCLILRGQKISKLKKSAQILNSLKTRIEENSPSRVEEKTIMNKERAKLIQAKTTNEQNIPRQIKKAIEQNQENFQLLKITKKKELTQIQKKYQRKKFHYDKIEKKKQKLLEKYGKGKGDTNIFQLEEKAEVLLDHLKKAKIKFKELKKLRSFSDRNVPSKEEICSESKQNKGQWIAKLMNDHPHLLRLRERLRPTSHHKSFSMLINNSKTPSPNFLSKEIVDQLIMQHFEFEGKPQIRKFIEFTTASQYTEYKYRMSPIIALLLLAIIEGSKLWDLNFDEKSANIDLPDLEVDELRNTQNKTTVRGLEDDDIETGINIWLEKQDSIKNIIYLSNEKNLVDSILYANVNKLIQKITPTNQLTIDLYFRDILIETYPMWITSEKLFFKLIQRYEAPIPKTFKSKGGEEKFNEMRTIVQKNVLSFLQDWLNKSFLDISPHLLEMIKNFLSTKASSNNKNKAKKLLSQIRDLAKKAKNPNYEIRSYKETPPDPIMPKNLFSPKLELSQVDAIEYARQLTLIRFSIFKKCRSSELVTQAWSKERLKHKAKNILTMISSFNRISFEITNQIINPLKLKNRVKQLTKFLKMGEYFQKINNYDGIMMTIAGLRQSSVNRLKFTHSELSNQSQQIFERLLELTDSLQNYSTLKEVIKNAPKPCLPHIGMYLTDLTFIFDGHPDKVDGLINFSKLKLIYNVISQIEVCKIKHYNFYPIYQIQKLFFEIGSHDKKELYNKSLEREPRNSKRSEII